MSAHVWPSAIGCCLIEGATMSGGQKSARRNTRQSAVLTVYFDSVLKLMFHSCTLDFKSVLNQVSSMKEELLATFSGRSLFRGLQI